MRERGILTDVNIHFAGKSQLLVTRRRSVFRVRVRHAIANCLVSRLICRQRDLFARRISSSSWSLLIMRQPAVTGVALTIFI